MHTGKYHNRLKADPIDGVPISWTAHPDGLPVRQGDAPALIERAQRDAATAHLYARSEVLDIPKDLKRYEEILDWVANGLAVSHKEREIATPDGWRVWVTWVDVRGVIPTNPPAGPRL